jgi:transcriptional regulator with XRE-family HTH domain
MREAAGLSQTEAARRARIPRPSLSKIERGLCGLSVDSLHRLLWVLGEGDVAILIGPYTTNGRGGEWS